jgi:hypothetical protein
MSDPMSRVHCPHCRVVIYVPVGVVLPCGWCGAALVSAWRPADA